MRIIAGFPSERGVKYNKCYAYVRTLNMSTCILRIGIRLCVPLVTRSGDFRLGRGTGPPNLAQPPKLLIGSRGVLGVYRRTWVYAVYQPLVFFDSA